LLFRIGGDEFLALAPVFSDQAEAAIRTRLDASCADCVRQLEDATVPIEYSFGIAAGLAAEAREVIHQADLAMYEAKKLRKRARSV
jgi:GGDEF domain-containing protein